MWQSVPAYPGYDVMSNDIQIKICGLTEVDQALACVELGVQAIGLVFFPKSPRFVDETLAREISTAVSPQAKTVGVFVDETHTTVRRKIEKCGLGAVQLHGRESSAMVKRLKLDNILVIKALFEKRDPMFKDAVTYDAGAFLLECGQGKMPGGNAQVWNWETARQTGGGRPIILAGGLGPRNVAKAVKLACPDAVDVSSGVEAAPGVKDLRKIQRFIKAVKKSSLDINYQPKKIF
jgi:phosphoribosylanthranilate isomerase/indole-3-glycerol phosphate synthase/phosphoribosylanthranilate isomerase